MVAIVGASGVGKSTLLHVLGGLDRVDAGAIAIAGIELTTLPDAERRRVPQPPRRLRLPVPSSAAGVHRARERCEMPMRIARMRGPRPAPRADELLRRVGLGERLTHRPGHAVGRRAAARGGGARAGHAAGACCWPTSRPATSTSRRPTRCTRCCARCIAAYGLTSIIATHNPRLAAACDRILRLEGGRLTAAQPVHRPTPDDSAALSGRYRTRPGTRVAIAASKRWGGNPNDDSQLYAE